MARTMVLLAATLISLSSCGQSSSPGESSSSTASDDNSRLAEFQVEAKDQLTSVLKDPDSAKYEDVHAYRHTNEAGQTAYVFCGKVNSKNGFGGYGGYQRFAATGGLAVLEEQASDFDQIWTQFCNGKEETIWW